MTEILKAIILGVVQGATEFLPVSSSGHLAVGRELLKFGPGGAFFDVFVHLGTLGAVVVFTRREILTLLRGCAGIGAACVRGNFGELSGRADVRLVWMVLVACVPTAVVGLGLELAEDGMGSLYVVGAAFIVTGVVLLATRLARQRAGHGKEARTARLLDALVVGAAQGVGATPGLSRSGLTIAAGLLRGLDPVFAARFSFVISVPAILGATLLRFVKALAEHDPFNWGSLVCAAAVAAFVGYACLTFLVAMVRRGRLAAFAWYLFPLGVVTIGLKLLGVAPT